MYLPESCPFRITSVCFLHHHHSARLSPVLFKVCNNRQHRFLVAAACCPWNFIFPQFGRSLLWLLHLLWLAAEKKIHGSFHSFLGLRSNGHLHALMWSRFTFTWIYFAKPLIKVVFILCRRVTSTRSRCRHRKGPTHPLSINVETQRVYTVDLKGTSNIKQINIMRTATINTSSTKLLFISISYQF